MSARASPSLLRKLVPTLVTGEVTGDVESGREEGLPCLLPPPAGSPLRGAAWTVIYLRCQRPPGAQLCSAQLSRLPGHGDRCEELAVGTNAMTGTGTKEGDRV